ncbi:hypothetical protein G6F57_021511 [Rhizopus arrhizus]|nr:hypothetical protein G6F28_014148 [Rhizopus arrhizus]KAG1055497.1 hypothetical protein G6F41_014178 [Rhizopus arrhizus]KAG1318574.1 hypothetical protein G6F63_015152 [Rhizopus arrhizus]KAG1434602.1 hypothetical protein G6F57_021511 [Rhizopus arrhizus]
MLLHLLLIPLISTLHYSRLQHWHYLSVNCLRAKLLVLITSRPRCSSRSVLTCRSFFPGSLHSAVNGLMFLLSGDMLKSIQSSRKVIHHFPQTTVQSHSHQYSASYLSCRSLHGCPLSLLLLTSLKVVSVLVDLL